MLKSKVLSSAVVAQTIYQNDNFGPPNMGTGTRICSPAKQRYFIHMMETNGKFVPDDDGAATNESTGIHYGRLYIGASRINSPISNPIGSILSVVAHEMLHSVQNGYRILGQTPKSYREGGATIYGKSIDNNQVITARPETTILSRELLDPVDKSPNRYGSEDFWAYVGKAYNGGKLEYLAGLYAQMRATLGPNTLNPSSGAMYGALDTYFKAKFSKSLQEIYLDFLKQRALTHNAASQFGRANEVTVGLAENLFAANAIAKRTIDVGNCAASKITLNGTFSPFSSPAIVITPTGSLPAGNTTGVTLTTKITTTSSSVGALWNGWTYRDNVATALADTNKFAGFGKSATDSVTLLIANVDPQNSSRFTLEVTCGGIKIDSLAPVRGKIGDVVTINGSGFGGASDVRKVTFNGVIATAVTWVSDSQLRATVPVNASTGSVIVTLGTEVSNGVSFEVVAACSAQQNAGTDVPDTRSIELGKTSGTFNFTYNTYTQKDRILVRYQNATVFDTGCVGMAATKSISYSGTQTFIVVEVQPNCEKPGSTSWDYSVSCP